MRSRAEQPFGQAKDKHGFVRCRYLGLAKYRIQALMTFVVVNSKRTVKRLTGIIFRELAKGIRKEVFKPVYASPPWAQWANRRSECAKNDSLVRSDRSTPLPSAQWRRVPAERHAKQAVIRQFPSKLGLYPPRCPFSTSQVSEPLASGQREL